jgi:hypothetical protein
MLAVRMLNSIKRVKIKRFLSVITMIVCAGGCASVSTFYSHTDRLAPLIRSVREDRPLNLSVVLNDKVRTADKVLYLMERGRLAQIQGSIRESIADFEAAARAIRAQDDKAVISLSGSSAQAGAIIVNDNAIPYRADGYERILLHHFQAINYLMSGNVDGASVEVRRAGAEQMLALRRHETELDTARRLADERNLPAQVPVEVARSYDILNPVAGEVKSSFQNACTFYLSGLVGELQGRLVDAYIDYKKALEIVPDNVFFGRDVLRLARLLGRREELDMFRSRYPAAATESVKQSVGTGDLVVLFEDDFVVQKQEIKLPVPLPPPDHLTMAAFPIYNIRRLETYSLSLLEQDRLVAQSEPACLVDALAIRALQEKVPFMTMRQIIRSVTKLLAARRIENELGTLGTIGSFLYKVASENADLRSWSTLPANIQVFRSRIAAGSHEFTFRHEGTGASIDVSLDVPDNGIAIVRVIRTGNRLNYARVYFTERKGGVL